MALGLCGKWMPRAQCACARGDGRGGSCKSPEAMERMRQRSAARVRPHDPVAKRRWDQASKLWRYGLTQEQCDRLLEADIQMARAYLDRPPARLLARVEAAA